MPKSPPLLPGEGWGEGKRTSESIEKKRQRFEPPYPRPPNGRGETRGEALSRTLETKRLVITSKGLSGRLLPGNGPTQQGFSPFHNIHIDHIAEARRLVGQLIEGIEHNTLHNRPQTSGTGALLVGLLGN